jgi:integrase
MNLTKRNGVYYLRAQVQSKRYLWSLDTGDKATAQNRARQMLGLLRSKRFDILDQMRARSDYATIGEIFKAFGAAAVLQDLRARTIDDYKGALRVVIHEVTGKGDVEAMPATVLTADLVRTFASKRLLTVKGDPLLEDRTRKSSRSTLRQARSIFSKWARENYQALKLPDLTGFLQATSGRTPTNYYVTPPQALRERTIAAGRALRESNPELYVAFMLCYDLALRAGEAQAARWDWTRIERDGRRYLDVVTRPDFRPKGRERSVLIGDETWRELQASRRNGNDYILPGKHKTARRKLVAVTLAAWMREQGWDARTYPKAAHELRKLMGSRWYTERGAEVAQTWLGHKDIATTCRYYATLDKAPAALPRE